SVFDGDDPPGAIDGGRTVVVTSGESFADALAVGPLASAMRLPIVLTRRDVLPAATRAHLDGPFGDSIDQVLVVGGTAVVSDEIVAEIEAMGHAVRRVAGGTRYETSSRIADLFADELFVPDDVVVARGDVFADALAAAPYAGSMGAPVLLAGDGTAPAWVADHDVDRVRLLGPAVLDPVPAATRWDPRVGDTWHLQLQGDLVTDLDVDVYDVDLFDTPASTIASLQADGRRVVCYFSAGSWEEWRPDADDWPEEAIGEPLDGWEGERWIDVRRLDLVGPVLGARLDLAEAKGCDGVDPDNVDGYDGHETGFDLDSNDTLVFVRHLVSEGHERSLAVGLKNALALVPTLADEVDFAVNEQCVAFDECDRLAPLAVHDAPVFGVEYDGSFDEVCAAAEDVGSWLLADLELDGRSRTCRTG
ncbi:MAG TPA: endo alpha-1,4 polygalactosaminidase, partial [Acidimicrobiales bacterium]|nr:endo alpha-1,4 polygalactosaminidase [Acidimicrobiales bacterium]